MLGLYKKQTFIHKYKKNSHTSNERWLRSKSKKNLHLQTKERKRAQIIENATLKKMCIKSHWLNSTDAEYECAQFLQDRKIHRQAVNDDNINIHHQKQKIWDKNYPNCLDNFVRCDKWSRTTTKSIFHNHEKYAIINERKMCALNDKNENITHWSNEVANIDNKRGKFRFGPKRKRKMKMWHFMAANMQPWKICGWKMDREASKMRIRLCVWWCAAWPK